MCPMSNSRLKDIYDCLKDNQVEVYFPGQHKGECTSNYVVVRDATSVKSLSFSTMIHYYDVLCYVPQQRFGDLEPFLEEVKKVMKQLVPMIKPADSETGSFYDESNKGWMKSVQYQNYRQIVK